MKNEADDLERIKRHLDNLYEQGETCIHPDTKVIVTDPEYDLLVKRLAHLRPDSKELQKPSSADFDANAKKVKHNPPMTSISKAIGTLQERTETLDDWFENCDKGLHYIMAGKKDIRGKNYVQAFKWDGVACALYYENGKLVRAGLRPRDGINGEDVTENIKYVEGVPEKLPLNISCCIRGEIICKKSVFEKINSALKAKGEKTYANPRNYATGSIRQFKDPEITKERRLNFTAYSIVGLNNPPYKNEVERAKWCAKTLGIPYVQVRPYRDEDLEKMEKFAPKLDYEVDGIVISVSVLEDQEQLGTHGNSPNGNPKGKIAWKFSDEIAVAKVGDIELNIGRTGNGTPVLIFETPVQLDGTSVTRCTGHNLGYMNENRIGIGTVIEVIKSGKIIPKAHKVVSGQTTWKHPTHCPTCKQPLIVRTGGEDKEALVCTNDFCGERAVAALCHYLTTFGVKGLSDSSVTKLYEAGLVKTPADFYTLQPADLIKLDGEDPRSSKEFRSQYLTVAKIHMIDAPDKIKGKKELGDAIQKAVANKHKVPLWQFFASLGIPTAGKSAGRALESHFKNLDNIRAAAVAQLNEVEEIGEKTAQVVYDYFRKYGRMIDDILQHVEVVSAKIGKLTDKTFVFTGSLPQGKEYWIKKVEDMGGKCGSSVSKKTDYVVVGTDAGSKLQKAQELGIKQLSLDDLKRML